MSIDAKGYFELLKASLNSNYYVTNGVEGELNLEEEIFIGSGQTKTHKIPLFYQGEAFFVKLDKKNSKGNNEPLFHFLENNSKPWASRCDFVIFNYHNRKINIYCIECKNTTIGSPEKQLDSSEAWCKSLQATINNYTGHKKPMNLTKYVFTDHPDPRIHLDPDGKNLRSDASIRHFLYNDAKNKSLSELDNSVIIKIN